MGADFLFIRAHPRNPRFIVFFAFRRSPSNRHLQRLAPLLAFRRVIQIRPRRRRGVLPRPFRHQIEPQRNFLVWLQPAPVEHDFAGPRFVEVDRSRLLQILKLLLARLQPGGQTEYRNRQW